MNLIVAILLLSFGLVDSLRAAEDDPPKRWQVEFEKPSPQGDFKLVAYRKPPGGWWLEAQIWLVALGPGLQTQRLFTHTNRAAWTIDAEENHIAINYHRDSGSNLVYLFTRGPQGRFRREPEELRAVALKEMMRMNNLTKMPEFVHLNCYADKWMADGQLTGLLSGDNPGGESKHYLQTWRFVYDLGRHVFVWDAELTEKNKGAFVVEPP